MSAIFSRLVNLSGGLITGVLAIANGGTNSTTATGAFNNLSPMTTAGDVIYGGTSGAGTRLAAGTSVQLFHSGTTPSWSAVSLTADVTGTLPVANGGTGVTSSTGSGNNVLSTSPTLATPTVSGVAVFSGTVDISSGTGLKLPTSGGTPATLASYETGTSSMSFGNPFNSTQTPSFPWTLLGNIVTLRITSVNAACAGGTADALSAGSLPARVRPATTLAVGYILGRNNSALDQTVQYRVDVTSSGSVDITRTAGNWTASGNCGWSESVVTYNLN